MLLNKWIQSENFKETDVICTYKTKEDLKHLLLLYGWRKDIFT